MLKSEQNKGRIVISSSFRGGTGKTTVAIHTAAMLRDVSIREVKMGIRDEPLKIVLVDLDRKYGIISHLLGVKDISAASEENISNALEPMEETTIQSNLRYVKSLDIHILSSPEKDNNVSPEFYQEIVAQLSEMFDVAVLDTGVNYSDPALRTVLPMADNIMYVTNLSSFMLEDMRFFMKELTSPVVDGGLGIKASKISAVINRTYGKLDHDLLDHISKIFNEVEILATIPVNNNLYNSETIGNHAGRSSKYSDIAHQLLLK